MPRMNGPEADWQCMCGGPIKMTSSVNTETCKGRLFVTHRGMLMFQLPMMDYEDTTLAGRLVHYTNKVFDGYPGRWVGCRWEA